MRDFSGRDPVRNTVNNDNCGGIIHVISPGDTLYLLSCRYHVSVSEIMYQNPYVNLYNLKPGDELCIPVSCGLRERKD